MFLKNNIPLELKGLNQWVVYKKIETGSHPMKAMMNPYNGYYAKSNEPRTWSSFYKANYVFEKQSIESDGLAFVLTGGLVFIDIDNCIDDCGAVSDFARNVVERFKNTYIERSCSGHGIHIICKGHLPKNARKRNDELGLEMYETKRFLCLTGDTINGRSELVDYTEEVKKLNEEYIGVREVIRSPNLDPITPTLSDLELIDRIKQSRNGHRFMSLYGGNTGGYPSLSNAEYAFCRMLAFWTQSVSQIDSIYRSSGLYRDKWDRPLGESTYGIVTITNAISEQRDVYKTRGGLKEK